LKRTRCIALLLPLTFATLASFSVFAQAQQIDVAFGLSSIFAPTPDQVTGDHQPQSLDGGAYLAASADYMFHKNVGVEGEFAWRKTQANYTSLNVPYRPLFYDFNAIWTSKVSHRASLELVAGAGVESIHFYSGSTYASSNHFMGDFGIGVKYYAWRHLFLRPEGRLYLVKNNLEFSSAHALRYGASIGYTFR
jgi:hypothetical protein